MSSITKYHFGKASYAINLIEGLKNEGVDYQRLINKSSLRYFNLNDSECMIPIPVIYEFIEQVQQNLGIVNLTKSFHGNYNLEKTGAYGLHIASSKKMLPAILTALKYGKMNLTNNTTSFKILNGGSVYYGTYYDSPPCNAQNLMNDIDLKLQLEFVLNANNEDWSPKEIHLIGSDTTIIEELVPNCKAKIVTNQKAFGLVFDLATLSKSILSDQNIKILKDPYSSVPEKLSGKIENIFDTLSPIYLPGITEMASMFNTSVSSFKRNLNGENVSFTVLLARWRFMKAVELLTNTNLKIKEISDQLFYNNPSNFIRAFKRTTGFSPNSFRD